jgi:hypothetical protein
MRLAFSPIQNEASESGDISDEPFVMMLIRAMGCWL